MTFNVLNCTRSVSLLKHGMRPVVFSEVEFELSGRTWTPASEEVSYTRNQIQREGVYVDKNAAKNIDDEEDEVEGAKSKQKRRSYYYTLQFKYRFEHS